MKSIIIGIIILGLVFISLNNESQNDNELTCKPYFPTIPM